MDEAAAMVVAAPAYSGAAVEVSAAATAAAAAGTPVAALVGLEAATPVVAGRLEIGKTATGKRIWTNSSKN